MWYSASKGTVFFQQRICMEKNTLVWLDLEMTGLNPERDVILEIATIITDDQLTIIQTGPHCIIHQPHNILDSMDSWCKKHHTASGLIDDVIQSNTTVHEAEEKTVAFLKQYCQPKKVLLCGNSVWQDRIFLQKYMPQLLNFFHYRIIDVSSIKELIFRWYPNNIHKEFKKNDKHRASDDIMQSIGELLHYRTYFFIKN
jgi:oligoribonuclease